MVSLRRATRRTKLSAALSLLMATDTCLVIGRTCLDEVIAVHTETTNIVHDSDSTTGPRANILPQDEQTLTLPRETGTLISSGSDFRP